MIKNKLYVYGESVQMPYHLHFGRAMLDKMAEFKNSLALVNSDTDERMTYAEMSQQIVDIALSLTRMGVRKGDVISICSDKRFEVLTTVLGIICAGATFSPTDITYGTVPLLHRLNIAQPKIMFCSSKAFELHRRAFDTVGCIQKYIIYGDEKQNGGIMFSDFITETAAVKDFFPVPVDGWKDYLFILFSSGTTGLPKGVPMTHMGFLANHVSCVKESFKGERLLNTREWYYTYGLLYTLAALSVGTTIVYSLRNTLADCLAAIQKYKIKFIQLAPATVTEIIKSPIVDDYDVSSVEGIMSASTPIMANQVQAVKHRLPNLKDVYQLYGLSEAGCVCNELYAPHGPRAGSAGFPTHGYIIKVVNIKTRHPLGPHERGEICIKSPSVTPGYLNYPSRDYMDAEGFFKTGDVGYYDQDGYFFIVDRLKELIKYNDVTIAPAELESILLQNSSVKDAGVVGAPSEEFGEAPTAFVVLQPGASTTEGEIVEFLESRITFRMKLAGGVRFVDQLPRGAGYKLDRNELRAML